MPKVDPTAIHTDTRSEFQRAPQKSAPLGGDRVLIESAEDGYTKRWSRLTDLPSGAGGETNTASNVNAGGVGVFKQKTGVDLEFRGVNAASGRISVALDAANNEIDIDVPDNGIANAALADMVAYSLKLRNAGTTGDPQDVKISALTEETAPTSGDWLLMEESGGALRKVDASGAKRRTVVTTAINVVLVVGDIGKTYLLTAGADLTLPAPASAGSGWWVEVKEAANSNASNVIRNAAESIDLVAANLSIKKKEARTLVTDGTDWWSI